MRGAPPCTVFSMACKIMAILYLAERRNHLGTINIRRHTTITRREPSISTVQRLFKKVMVRCYSVQYPIYCIFCHYSSIIFDMIVSEGQGSQRSDPNDPNDPTRMMIDPQMNFIMLRECQLAICPDEDGDL